ncbi:MAG: hypothetical protein KAU46_05905 [Candidatus Aminicenantes bacterium]|nr:hypothetical protein [Candidatus Aminicenantes bacterium]
MGQDLHSWARIYGGSNSDTASSIQQTIDGGYIVAGRTGSFGAGYIDSWILKLDSVGDIEWQHTYGGIDSDRASSIQQTTDGGYIVAGYTHSFGAGDNDYWILKLTSNGDIEWQRTYGGTDGDKAYSIQQTSDGGYIVAGYTHSFGAGDYDYLILKLSSIGDIEWQRSYGGNDHEEASSIQQTSDGGYIVAGYTWSYIAGYLDIWILKLTSSGNIEWQRTYGGTNGDKAYSIQQTSDGGYIVTGIFGYSGFMEILSCDFWVLKLSSSGDIEWQRTYGGSSTPGHVRENCAYSIQQTSDGGYIVAGSTWSFGAGWHDFLILKLTSSGDIEWQRTYGGTDGDKAYSIQQTLDGGYIVAGYSESFYVPRRPYKIDILVLKLSSSGEILYFPEIVVGITTVTVSDTSITPQDTYIVPQEINITPQDTNIIPQNSNARESWLFSLPLNFTGKMELNRSLSQAEYINVLTWEANPNNEDLNIVKYRIYQVEGESQSLLVELNAGTFKYWHRNVEKDKEYAYVIVAVNDDGGEGVPAYVKVQ